MRAQERPAPTQAGNGRSVPGEWRYYGGDKAFTRYSPLDQIDRNTVKNLRILTVDTERNLVVLRGAIPGPIGGLVMIRKKILEGGAGY